MGFTSADHVRQRVQDASHVGGFAAAPLGSGQDRLDEGEFRVR